MASTQGNASEVPRCPARAAPRGEPRVGLQYRHPALRDGRLPRPRDQLDAGGAIDRRAQLCARRDGQARRRPRVDAPPGLLLPRVASGDVVISKLNVIGERQRFGLRVLESGFNVLFADLDALFLRGPCRSRRW